MTTIYDIAKATGLAKSTVANALSGKGSVSEATRQRILRCAEELGYRPSTVARSLSSHKTFTIALVLPNIANPFYPEMAEAVESVAREHEYHTLLCNTHADFASGKQQMERLISRWVDGYIIMGSSMNIADLTQYAQRGLPIVLCDWQENESPEPLLHVSADFFQAGALAAQHLLDLGHRNIAVIGDEPQQTQRLQGFCSVLQQAGLTLSPQSFHQGHSTSEGGYRAAQAILASVPRPTALFATTDWMAIGAMDAIAELGLRIPHDISLIGLDDIVLAKHIRPSLTTVAVSKPQIARVATELLLSRINGKEEPATSRIIEPYLVIRQSTAMRSSEPEIH